MTPLKTIAGKIERDKHHAEGAKRIGENLARFKPKVKKEGGREMKGRESNMATTTYTVATVYGIASVTVKSGGMKK